MTINLLTAVYYSKNGKELIQYALGKKEASFTIPAGVISIGDFAFSLCYSLTIYCEAKSQPDGWDRYWNCDDCPVEWEYKIGE